MVVKTGVMAVDMARMERCGNPHNLVIGQIIAVLESQESRMVSGHYSLDKEPSAGEDGERCGRITLQIFKRYPR